MSTLAAKLAELGLFLPEPPVAVAAYVPYVVTGDLVFISGQLPVEHGRLKYTGHLGEEVDVPTGIDAAKICALNLLAQLNHACDGDIARVARCVKLNGFVSSTPDFFEQPKIINGASELMLSVLGDLGRHARAAVGVPALPLNAPVEVDAVFALRR